MSRDSKEPATHPPHPDRQRLPRIEFNHRCVEWKGVNVLALDRNADGCRAVRARNLVVKEGLRKSENPPPKMGNGRFTIKGRHLSVLSYQPDAASRAKIIVIPRPAGQNEYIVRTPTIADTPVRQNYRVPSDRRPQ